MVFVTKDKNAGMRNGPGVSISVGRASPAKKGHAMTRIEVRTDNPYSIHMGRGISGNLAQYARLEGRRVLVVTDRRVAALHLSALERVLDSVKGLAGRGSVILPGGETGKNLAALERVYRALDEQDLDRGDLIIAFGGGVVGDIAGFAAATWNRGIGFIQVPTTILAMADSSVGGKTGVDFRQRKNGVGAFHQPEAVIMDLAYLDSLPARQVSNGMAEVVKSALIADPGLLSALAEPHPDMEDILSRAVRVKVDIVQRDPTEQGERALLNLGHTYGHALEAYHRYRKWLHGEAVAIGLMFACPSRELKAVLERWSLPTDDSSVKPRDLVPLMFRDKKRSGAKLRFVLLESPGKPYLRELSREELAQMADAAFSRPPLGGRP
jgi:3-dehydroquinate synthase